MVGGFYDWYGRWAVGGGRWLVSNVVSGRFLFLRIV